MRLRYRPFQAIAIATLAALVTACAAFAPLYDRAMRQALTDIKIERTAPAVVGLQLRAIASDPRITFGSHVRTRPPEPEAVLAKVPEDMRASYLAPVLGYSAEASVPKGELPPTDAGGPTASTGHVIWRDGACDHVDFTEGGCPTSAGDVAISEADARTFGLRVGESFKVPGIPLNQASATVPSARLHVSGVYRQQPGDYWFGLSLTGLSGIVDPETDLLQHDLWLTDRATFTDSSVPPLNGQASTVDLPLDRDAVGVDDVLGLAGGIQRLAGEARHDTGVFVDVHSGLPSIVQDIRDQTGQSRVTVPLLMAQLGLLAVIVLWLVLLAVTEQRRPEVALARLRGRGRRGARGLLLAELLPVALAGVVPGAAVAVLGAWVARTQVLPGHAPFELGLRFVAAVALAVVVLTAVTLLAVSRVAREPVATLLRRVPPRRTGWSLGVGDALVVAGAGAVVVLFATGGLDGPVALAAPGLVAIVVGLVLAHLTSPSAAVVGRRLVARGRVRFGVSILDAARSPATRRVVAMVTVAAALAVFSADALAVGDRNRAAAAEQQAGAPMVAEIRGNDLAAVRAALHEVDPDGRRVTPVVRMLPPGSDSGGTLAVVPDAFRRIAILPGSAGSASVWDRLAVPDTKPIQATGTHLSLDVDDSTLVSRREDGKPSPVTLGLDLVTRSGETLHTTFGDLGGPTHHRRFGTDVSCGDGCYVTSVWVSTLPGATIDGEATLRHLVGTPGGQEATIGPADRWRSYVDAANGSFRPRSTAPDRLTLVVHSNGPSLVSMAQTWLQPQAPALVSRPLPPDLVTGRFTGVGLDAEDQPAVRVGALPRVPGARPGTVVVNLDAVTRGRTVSAGARMQLWFAHDDPAFLARTTKALADHDVFVASTSTLAGTRRTYDESTAAWSLGLAVVIGIAALLIALLVLVVSAVSTWRFRVRDLAALRMSGIPGGAIGTMAVAAQLPAVLLGVVAGTAAGLVGAQLALPIVPLFATAPEVSTLDLATAWGGVAGAAVGAAVVLGLGAVLIGRALARRSDVRRLRETV
ncbi:FtsX-like permease family protein [Nocardioides ungokensis]|uniref:FtsX-like permease family protein n=1 Tax=Nocardioides ungokensis TaxID=1643322 RepID=UPI0015DED930|nr:FtsX-like permease family protein [Nocardioides ungokensis]